jgi:protein-tyrosine phosphatase
MPLLRQEHAPLFRGRFVLHILFVCTGNVCRSPVAERLATTYANGVAIPEFVASSVGTRALVGHPVHPDAAHALEQLGGDASHHAARQVSAKLLMAADLVLTMSTAHRNSVLELAPRQINRAFTLHEAARLASHSGAHELTDLRALRSRNSVGELPDIADPIGRSAAFHAAVANEIADLLPPILELCRHVPPSRLPSST